MQALLNIEVLPRQDWSLSGITDASPRRDRHVLPPAAAPLPEESAREQYSPASVCCLLGSASLAGVALASLTGRRRRSRTSAFACATHHASDDWFRGVRESLGSREAYLEQRLVEQMHKQDRLASEMERNSTAMKKQFQDQLGEQKSAGEELRKQLEAASAEKERLVMEQAKLESETADAVNRVAETHRLLTEVETTNKTLEEKVLAMETENQQLMSCQEALKENQISQKHLSEKLSKSNSKIEELVTRLHFLEAEMATKDREATSLLDDTKTALEMREASENLLSKKLSKSQSENEELVAKLQLLEAEMVVKDREASKLLGDMEASLSSTLKKNATIEKVLFEKLSKSHSNNEQLLAKLCVLGENMTADDKTAADVVVDVHAFAETNATETVPLAESKNVVETTTTAEHAFNAITAASAKLMRNGELNCTPTINGRNTDELPGIKSDMGKLVQQSGTEADALAHMVDAVAEEKRQLVHEQERLQSKAAEAKRHETQLQNSLAKEITKNQTLEEKVPILEAENQRLMARLDAVQNVEVPILEAENQRLASRLDAMHTVEASVKRLSEELNRSHAGLQHYREKIAAMDKAATELSTRLEASESREKAAVAAAETANQHLDSTLEALESAELRVKRVSEELNESHAGLCHLREKVASMEEVASEHSASLEASESREKTAVAEAAAAREQLQSRLGALENMESSVRRLSKELDRSHSGLRAFREKAAAMEQTNSELSTSLEASQSREKAALAEADAANELLKSRRADLANMKASVSSLSNELHCSKAGLRLYRKKVTAMDKAASKLSSRLELSETKVKTAIGRAEAAEETAEAVELQRAEAARTSEKAKAAATAAEIDARAAEKAAAASAAWEAKAIADAKDATDAKKAAEDEAAAKVKEATKALAEAEAKSAAEAKKAAEAIAAAELEKARTASKAEAAEAATAALEAAESRAAALINAAAEAVAASRAAAEAAEARAAYAVRSTDIQPLEQEAAVHVPPAATCDIGDAAFDSSNGVSTISVAGHKRENVGGSQDEFEEGQRVLVLGPPAMAGKLGIVVGLVTAETETFAVRFETGSVFHISKANLSADLDGVAATDSTTSEVDEQVELDVHHNMEAQNNTVEACEQDCRSEKHIDHNSSAPVNPCRLGEPDTCELNELEFQPGQHVSLLGPPPLVGKQGTIVGPARKGSFKVRFPSGSVFHIATDFIQEAAALEAVPSASSQQGAGEQAADEDESEFQPGQTVQVLCPPPMAGKHGTVVGHALGDDFAVRLGTGSVFNFPAANLQGAGSSASAYGTATAADDFELKFECKSMLVGRSHAMA